MIFRHNGEYHIAWYGAAQEASGYGGSNLAIVRTLQATKVRVHAIGFGNSDGEITPEDCAVGVAYGPSGMGALERIPSPYRILFTMFEADRWPQEWVSTTNAANQVWVPSGFCRDSLLASGCESPVTVVPLGIDPEVFSPGDPSDREHFVFGYAGTASARKGFDILIRAFQEEFTDSERVELHIQSASILSSSIPDDDRVKVHSGAVSQTEMAEFYRSVDCFVMPTHGEGFGLTALEAMASGCCVAVTDWGGCKDYLGDHALRIAIDGLQSAAEYYNCGGRWARPSLNSTRYCMRWVFEHPAEARALGLKAADYVRQQWTYARTARIIDSAVRKVNPKERLEVEERDVVVWHGNPRKVTTCIGGFTRGIPRELSPEQVERLNPGDMGAHGFLVERRLRRAVGSV